MTRRMLLVIASALAVVAAVTGAAFAAPAVRAATRTAVVAIGDSIMDGHGLNAGQSWPAVVARDDGWHLTDLAADGDGFVTKGNDGTTFADQVRHAIALHPQVILLAGSSNDLGEPETVVEAAIRSQVRLLHTALPQTRIIAVNPVWNEATPPAQLVQIGTAVRAAVTAVGGAILDIGRPLYGHPEFMQSDDVHPTAAGQLAIATAVEQQLSAAGLD